MATVVTLTAAGASASGSATPGSKTPELVPFIGTFTVTATWGKPSGGYHAKPALDVSIPTGTPIYAAGDGVVSALTRDGGRCDPKAHGGGANGVRWCIRNGFAESGTRITIRHPDGRRSLYLHLSEIAKGVEQGSKVTAGQPIARSGNTGISEAPHLHYEERDEANKSLDPGVWVGCSRNKPVEYTDLQLRVNQPISNAGFDCLEGVAPSPLSLFVGKWVGKVAQPGCCTYGVTLTIRSVRIGARARVVYSDIDCGGFDTIASIAASGRSITFHERITYSNGSRGCLDAPPTQVVNG